MLFLQKENIALREPRLETDHAPRANSFSKQAAVAVILVSLIVGGLLGYTIYNSSVTARINDLHDRLDAIQGQVSGSQATQNVTYQNVTYLLGENVSLSSLYEQVKDSVVTVRGVIVEYGFPWGTYCTQVQGSGFVYNLTGEIVIVTNFHVVEDATNITVTFVNGNGYSAALLGADPYADLAVLSANAPQNECKPLDVTNSSSLEVGDPVIVVGNPYGLTGSMTTGIVSALGRTITEDMTEGYPIANVIQTSAPINSGNSGGPLLNYKGQVVGITTAIVSDSQGLGFAIPSNTIIREIQSLANTGFYDQHPWLGTSGVDMTYEVAEAMNTNATCGYLIVRATENGPADKVGLQGGTQEALVSGECVAIGGDVITAINNGYTETRIRGVDDLSTFLEEYTLPNRTIYVTIVRENQTLTLEVTLGT